MTTFTLPVTGVVLTDHGFRVEAYRPFHNTPVFSDDCESGGTALVFQGAQIVGVIGNQNSGDQAGFKGLEPQDNQNFDAWVLENVVAGSLGGNVNLVTLVNALMDEAKLSYIVEKAKLKGYILGSLTREDGGIELNLVNHTHHVDIFSLPQTPRDVPAHVVALARESRAQVWGANGWIVV